ncbi:MAG: PKD domain-containing protein [bacterium]|nr:PKD domain-containing protein [bacterium]
MKKHQLIYVTLFLVIFSTCLLSKVQVGEHVQEQFAPAVQYTCGSGVVFEEVFNHPGAGYIALHFGKFKMAPGDYVEVSNESGSLFYLYDGDGKLVNNGKDRISTFWATHIPGDTAIVRLHSKNLSQTSKFVITEWVHGYEPGYIEAVMSDLVDQAKNDEAICSADDKEWAKCYEGTTMYTESKAVCRLLINGSSACTGWLLGSEGHIMTNNHCIDSSSDANNTDYEFMAEGASCSTACSSWMSCPGTVEASSGTLVKTSSTLDYSLVLLPTNLTSTYGYMQLRDTLPTIGERIYIPQHPAAKGKQLSVNSDVDNGYSQVYSTSESPCMGGPGDIGYYADTEGGSSGSPVLAYDDHLVIALHHCANCPNRGVPIPSIITDLGSSLPNNAIGSPVVNPPVAEFSANTTSIMVGGSVSFSDLSTNTPTSWSWSFDGGTPASSTSQNPGVIYNSAGTYAVTLTATNSAGSDSETKTGYITVNTLQVPAANFTASATSIVAGNDITFTDTSSNSPTSWSWTFAGGTPGSSTAQNPSINYPSQGTYDVVLTVTNAAGSDTETKVGYINVTAPDLYCSAGGNDYSYEWIAEVSVDTMSNASGAAGYTDFTSVNANLTSGDTVGVTLTPGYAGTVYSEYWRIYIDYNNDGDFSDSGEEVYSDSGSNAQTGSFTVKAGLSSVTTRMRVVMDYSSSVTACGSFTYGEVEDYTVVITGATVLPPVANFTASSTVVNIDGSVTFSDTSTNTPTSWSWSFDGGTPATSTAQNPSVTYSTAGTYNVTLTATNSAGSDSETKTAYITVNDVSYCTASGNNQNYEWIAGVTFDSFTNDSGASGYTDYTDQVVSLSPGASVGLTLTPGFASGSYTEYWKIFIDYNGDGDFDDTGEEVYSGSGSSAVSGNFTVSSSASGTTRMRVVMNYSSSVSACGTFTYGEVEDYTVSF